MNEVNQKQIHSVLNKHAKDTHSYDPPLFNVRTADFKNNRFEITSEY